MKMVEIEGGLRIPVSNDENMLIDKVKKHKSLEVSKLNEREQELLINLVRRNVLNMSKGKVTYNSLQSAESAIW